MVRGLWVRFGGGALLLCALLLTACGGAVVRPTATPPALATPLAAVTTTAATAPNIPTAAVAVPTPTLTAQQAAVPAKATETLRYIRTHNGDPPPGYTGGTTFENRERRLPQGRYKEYDVDPKRPGTSRNAERLVINQTTGQAYYTGDHYETFVLVPEGR